MNEELSLVYYVTQAANRRHFQSLFFAVTGFTWSFSLAAFAVFESQMTSYALLVGGLSLIGGSLIAHRLLLRERAAFEAMIAVWRRIAKQEETSQAKTLLPGAMAIACGVQAIVGGSLIALWFAC